MKKTTQIELRVTKGYKVDRDAGTLTNLSLITAGREATGHGIYIDDKTLSTGLDAINAAGGHVKGAMRHPSITDFITGRRDRVLDFPGWFSGISIKNNQLVAEKFEFFDTFRESNPETFARIMEMAEKTPGIFGLSIEAGGTLSYVDEDGNEHAALDDDGDDIDPPEGAKLRYNGLPAFRITNLSYAAFVDRPAANTGLFANLSALFGGNAEARELRQLAAAFVNWASSGTGCQPVDGGGAAASAAATTVLPLSATTETKKSTTTAMSLIKELKAKFGADEKRLSSALAILTKADDPETLTLAAIETQLAAAELTALTAQLAALTTERDDLKAQLAALTAERDGYKARLEALKTKGVITAVDLGVTGGESAATGETNPWATATFNRTEQIRLLRADPKKAETLKAAATS